MHATCLLNNNNKVIATFYLTILTSLLRIVRLYSDLLWVYTVSHNSGFQKKSKSKKGENGFYSMWLINYWNKCTCLNQKQKYWIFQVSVFVHLSWIQKTLIYSLQRSVKGFGLFYLIFWVFWKCLGLFMAVRELPSTVNKGSLVIVGYFPLIQLHVSTQSQSLYDTRVIPLRQRSRALTAPWVRRF